MQVTLQGADRLLEGYENIGVGGSIDTSKVASLSWVSFSTAGD